MNPETDEYAYRPTGAGGMWWKVFLPNKPIFAEQSHFSGRAAGRAGHCHSETLGWALSAGDGAKRLWTGRGPAGMPNRVTEQEKRC